MRWADAFIQRTFMSFKSLFTLTFTGNPYLTISQFDYGKHSNVEKYYYNLKELVFI